MLNVENWERVSEALMNGNTLEYMKSPSGTCYRVGTPARVIEILEGRIGMRDAGRLHLDYGDMETGRSWNEEYDVAGYIGRSMGRIKIPILVHNRRSFGGGAILTNCIVAIFPASKKEGTRPLYQHPNYHKEEAHTHG